MIKCPFYNRRERGDDSRRDDSRRDDSRRDDSRRDDRRDTRRDDGRDDRRDDRRDDNRRESGRRDNYDSKRPVEKRGNSTDNKDYYTSSDYATRRGESRRGRGL